MQLVHWLRMKFTFVSDIYSVLSENHLARSQEDADFKKQKKKINKIKKI